MSRQTHLEVVHTPGQPQPWHGRIRASNGRITWTTETYTRRRGVVRAIENAPGFTGWHRSNAAALFGTRYYAVRDVEATP